MLCYDSMPEIQKDMLPSYCSYVLKYYAIFLLIKCDTCHLDEMFTTVLCYVVTQFNTLNEMLSGYYILKCYVILAIKCNTSKRMSSGYYLWHRVPCHVDAEFKIFKLYVIWPLCLKCYAYICN